MSETGGGTRTPEVIRPFVCLPRPAGAVAPGTVGSMRGDIAVPGHAHGVEADRPEPLKGWTS